MPVCGIACGEMFAWECVRLGIMKLNADLKNAVTCFDIKHPYVAVLKCNIQPLAEPFISAAP